MSSETIAGLLLWLLQWAWLLAVLLVLLGAAGSKLVEWFGDRKPSSSPPPMPGSFDFSHLYRRYTEWRANGDD